MTATKETARQAIDSLDSLWRRTDLTLDDVKFLLDFLRAAERKLPTQAAVDRDRARRKGVKS